MLQRHLHDILSCLRPRSSVTADKDFNIKDILVPMGLRLNILPQRVRSQFREGDVVLTHCIVRVLIHVERAIGGIKNSVM